MSTGGEEPGSGVAAVSSAELVDLAAGRLAPERARQVRARLATDPQMLAAYGRLRARAETPTPGPGPEPTGFAPGLRGRTTALRVAVIAGAASVAVLGVALFGHSPVPGPDPAVSDVTPVITVPADRVGGLWPGLGEYRELGFLSEGNRLASCFVFRDPLVLGSRPVIVEGRYGIAVASVDPDAPDTVRVEVFSPGCGIFADDSAIIAAAAVPR